MPFLRFGRDKRGYETTALVHASRKHGRGQLTILYWFRSPAGVKVGRPALDEDAIRLIEEHNPDLLFDWSRILEVHQPASPPWPGPDRGPRSSDSETRRRTGGDTAARTSEGPASRAPSDRRRRQRRGVAEPVVGAELARPLPAEQPSLATETLAAAVDMVQAAEPDSSDATAIVEQFQGGPDEAPAERVTAAHQRFSLEDLERLRGRHAVLLRRIDEQVTDVDAAELLRARAEALDPDTWVTPGDVNQALEEYERVHREIRDALGPRRPRQGKPA